MTSEMIQNPNVIQFPKLGWEFEINPTAFTVFGISIQWYGIIIAFGLLLAVLYCFPRMKKFGIDADRATDAVIGGVIGGVIGARLYFVAMKWDEYRKDTLKDTFLAVINTRNGGLAIYGGIIGALIVGLTICRIKKVKILPMLDISVLGFLIGQGIGRWGNFVNQEAFGINTDSLFGMTGGRIQQVINNQMQIGGSMYENGLEMMWENPVHPCFLYESVWCLLGFAILAFFSKHRKYDGQILLMYMAWYGAERAVVEGLRTDSLMWGNIRVSQMVSVIILIASVILQIIIGLRVKRDPESHVLYVNTDESRLLIEETRRRNMGIDEEALPADDEDDEIGILPDEEENGDDNIKEDI
ncbi:MAG: prolipoprotein diacylglyceryl transferase [Ruminococcus flavefaciens]|nr:prolipoprotein diacylglyceryl transferase [Ruminococcus flavefaciens]